MTFTKALGSFFNQGIAAGFKNFGSLFSANKEILLIEDEIDQAAAILQRQANSLVSYLADLVEIRVLNKQDAFGMLLKVFNVAPEKQAQRLKFDVVTDKYLVASPLESHTDHLTIDGYHTRVLTLREEPSESRPLVLQQLLRIPATYHIVTEWRAVETNEAFPPCCWFQMSGVSGPTGSRCWTRRRRYRFSSSLTSCRRGSRRDLWNLELRTKSVLSRQLKSPTTSRNNSPTRSPKV
jgi:hypothetical protein